MMIIVIEDLLAAAARIEARGPEAVEQAARKSALWTIERSPGCGIDRIMAQQGLDLEHASGGYELCAGKS